MIALGLATLFFVALHLLVAGTALRDHAIARLGSGGYRGVFAAASVLGLLWLCLAYAHAPWIPLWTPAPALKPVAMAGVLVAILFVTLGVTTPSPTAVGGEALLHRGPGAIGIQRITRHPFLWGVALWALIHLMVNGDAASLLLFGGLLVIALAGGPSIDRKRRRLLGADWAAFAAKTSNLPFLAIAQGRNRLTFGEHKLWQWLVALAAYGLLLALHQPLFGVSPLPD